MHTNYDVLGMAELSGHLLGLQDMDVFEVTDTENAIGYGRIGYLEKEMTLEECCEYVKQRFSLPGVRLFGNKNKIVKRAAILPGSGKDMITTAISKKAEVYITGDISHHDGIDALAQGVAVIDAGHYGLEHIFVNDMVSYLEQYLEEVLIEKAEIFHPFQII